MAIPPSTISSGSTNLPTISRLFAEDYKDAPAWFTKQFISTMNLYMQSMYGIANQGINIMQNTQMEEYAFSFTCNSATASNNTYNFIPRKFVGKPFGVLIAQCYDTTVTSPTAIGNPVTLDWYFSGNLVYILAIYGLTLSHTYSISLLIF